MSEVLRANNVENRRTSHRRVIREECVSFGPWESEFQLLLLLGSAEREPFALIVMDERDDGESVKGDREREVCVCEGE